MNMINIEKKKLKKQVIQLKHRFKEKMLNAKTNEEKNKIYNEFKIELVNLKMQIQDKYINLNCKNTDIILDKLLMKYANNNDNIISKVSHNDINLKIINHFNYNKKL